MDRDPPFFLVWRHAGAEPRVRHDSQGKAEAEAKRIASLNPGEDVFVLAPIMRAAVPPNPSLTIERFALDDVPF